MLKNNLNLKTIITLSFLVWLSFAFADKAQALVPPVAGGETITRVRQSCSGYTLGSDCFTSLSSWEAANGGIDFTGCTAGDLTCVNTSAVAQIEGAWTVADATAVAIDGWTTDNTRNIKIYTTDEARHNGVWNNNKYRLEGTANANYYETILSLESNVTIEGLQVLLINSGGYTEAKAISIENIGSSGEVKISENIVKGEISSTDSVGVGIIVWDSSATSASVWNNIVYDFINGTTNNNGIRIYTATGGSFVYNNTIHNCYNGITTSYECAVVKNNIVQSCADGFAGAFYTNSDFNISDIVSDAPSPSYRTNLATDVTFLDEANDNFHLSPSDTVAINAGVDLSSDANLPFNTDIDGDERKIFDIGADEYMPVEFVSIVDPGNGAGTEYTSLTAWEAGVQTDLTAATTKVFSGTQTGTVADNTNVTGSISGVTATVVHATATQILLENISGVFQSGEQVRVDVSNYVTISNAGDSAIAVATCRTTNGTADTNAVTIDGWVTNAENYIKVWTDPSLGSRHGGEWDDNKYRLAVADYSGSGFLSGESFVRIDGLQISITSSAYDTRNAINITSINVGTSDIKISNNIIKGVFSGTSRDGFGINIYDEDADVSIWNNIVYDYINSGQTGLGGIIVSSGNANVYNNTVYNSLTGLRRNGGVVYAKNNIVQNCTDGYNGTFDASSDYNISDLVADAPGTHSKNSTTVQFRNIANDDLHLAGSDTAAKDAGVDLSADTELPLTSDIDGQIRPNGTAFDIGADEWSPVVTAGGSGVKGAPPILDLSFDEGYGDTAHNSCRDEACLVSTDGTLNSGGSGTNATNTAMWDKGGKFGGAMEFDGGDGEYIDTDTVDNMEEFSACAWVKPYSFLNEDGDNSNQLFGKGWSFRFDNAGKLQFYMPTSGVYNWVYSADNLTVSNWQHVCFVYSGLNAESKIFLNGVDNSEGAQTTTSSRYDDSADILRLGASFSNETFANFNGLLDDVKIYNYALSEDEIKVLYNNSSAMSIGDDASRDNNGTLVTGASKDYCVPGDTAQCDKPVLELKLDEMSGTTAFDKSGNGNNGTLTGGPTWEPVGKIGSALNFNGNNSYIDLGTSSTINPYGNNYTLQSWIYLREHKNDYTDAIFARGTDACGFDMGISGALNSTQNRIFLHHFNTGTPQIDYGNTDVSLNTWHHISVSYNNTTHIATFYLDGKMDGQKTINAMVDCGARNAYVGIDGRDTDGFVPNGMIDDLKLYNYARTPAQIAWDYNRGKPVAQWKFDEGQGTSVFDFSGNGNTGTMTNMDAGTDWVDGKFGKALDFDGVNDYVNLGPGGNYDGNEGAISMWIKTTSGSVIKFLCGDRQTGSTNYLQVWINNGIITTRINNTIAYNATGSSINNDGKWHNIVSTWGANGIKQFVDGVLDGENAYGGAWISGSDFRLGSIEIYQGDGSNFSGIVDNMKIYNYALTNEQIKVNYNEGAINFRQ